VWQKCYLLGIKEAATPLKLSVASRVARGESPILRRSPGRTRQVFDSHTRGSQRPGYRPLDRPEELLCTRAITRFSPGFASRRKRRCDRQVRQKRLTYKLAPAAMDTLTLLAELVKATAWPLTTAVVAILFRTELRALLGRLRKGKVGSAEFEFQEGGQGTCERHCRNLACSPTRGFETRGC
jgi:hypothetical protein